VVECADRNIESDQVIVATGAHATQRRPSFAADLDPQIIQLHAGEYRNPSQLQKGGVLVVGAGKSGSEIAIESAQAGHRARGSLAAALARCHRPRTAVCSSTSHVRV
jgi:cation diffusion facilitator CzcD-associated flavoprotein CzcO